MATGIKLNTKKTKAGKKGQPTSNINITITTDEVGATPAETKVQKYTTIAALTEKQVNSLISSILAYHRHADGDKPADSVIVFKDTVKRDEDVDDTFHAVVKISKEWCGTKVHKANLKFKARDYKILPATIEYVR